MLQRDMPSSSVVSVPDFKVTVPMNMSHAEVPALPVPSLSHSCSSELECAACPVEWELEPDDSSDRHRERRLEGCR